MVKSGSDMMQNEGKVLILNSITFVNEGVVIELKENNKTLADIYFTLYLSYNKTYFYET